MTANNFSQALKNVLVHEGGYVNHPKDPGGATNQGVTQAVYDSYRSSNGKPTQSVKNLSPQERDAIYKKRYWDVIKGDDLPDGIDYCVYDAAVNSGPSQAGKWLQRALGTGYKGTIDGIIGDETLRAVAVHPNHDALVAGICEQRLKFMRALKTWPTFGKGWSSRVASVKKVAQKWASGDVGASPVQPGMRASEGNGIVTEPVTAPKAVIADAQAAPSRAPGDITAGAGGLAFLATIGAYFSDIIIALAPYEDAPMIRKIIIGATLGSIVITGAGIFYRRYASAKKAELKDALNTDGPET